MMSKNMRKAGAVPSDGKQMSLKEIQNAELELMILFDRAVRKHGLRYSLSAGTLLGAVRHKGFIPWDDDIDVMMPRPDYEKLIRLNREERLWPEHVDLCSLEDGTLESPYSKLFDRRTAVVEHNFTQKDVRSLWIDIFPVDGLPEESRRLKRHYKRAMALCRMNVASVVRNGYGSGKLAILFKDIFMKPVSRMIGRKQIADRQKKLALLYPFERSELCGMVTWAYDGPGQAVSTEEYDKLAELPFEGQRFYVISCWEQYLTGVFGEYMHLPPEEERITHELEAYWL